MPTDNSASLEKPEPPNNPFSKGYEHRHGEPVSDACGDGKHGECTQDHTKCHCTYRSGHMVTHAYMYPPTAPSSSPLETPSQIMRCAVCGWPLAESADKGCVRGNCSMRPIPDRIYDPVRANTEYGKNIFKVPAESSPKPAESLIERARAKFTVREQSELSWIVECGDVFEDEFSEQKDALEFVEIWVDRLVTFAQDEALRATPSPEPPRQDQFLKTLREIHALARWDGPDAAPKRMHEIWQKAATMIENFDWAASAKTAAPSSHSEPELVKLRRILRELVDECRSFGSPTLSLIDEVEAALASTPHQQACSLDQSIESVTSAALSSRGATKEKSNETV